MLRVLHDVTGPTDRSLLIESAKAMRDLPGCASAEAYGSLVPGEEHAALAVLFEDESAFVTAWERINSVPATGLRALFNDTESCWTEFYAHADFAVAGGIWSPVGSDPAGRRIFWPARGQVRILIQYAVEPDERMRDIVIGEIVETRREPGCIQYDWMENLELPDHLLLLEVWSDQVIYDRHAQKRVDTAAFRGDARRRATTPTRGPVSREFYRRQVFSPQYDRWLPLDVAEYSASVNWPAS